MERIRIYFKPIWYNIVRHKAYAGFCVFGTMLTFVFITILLQIVHVVRGNMPPAFHAERIIEVPTYILDERGNNFTNRWNRKDVQLLMGQLKGYENYTCYHDEAGNIRTNGQFGMSMAVYTDYNYWNVFQFDFVQGRPFTEQEARDRWVVVNEGIAKTYFTKESVIGEKLYFQGNEYQIIGVVANVSLFAQDGNLSLWLPEHFDRGVSGNDWVNTFILFPEEADMENAKKMVTHAVNRVAEMKHVNVNNLAEPIRTVQEVRSEFLGGDFWVIGVLGVILLLLAIPILNIILLSLANTNIQVDVQTTDSTTGVSSTVEGSYDIGMASRDLKDDETAQGVEGKTIAKDGIAVIVNNESSVDELSTDQVKSIFTGETTSWSDITK